MPSSDTIKNLTSSLAAVFIVGYGMWQIGQYISMGIISSDAGLAILGPLIGGAATWLLNRESATQAVRSQDRAFTLGANTAQPQATVTTTAGPPLTTTVTPSPPEPA